MDELSPALEEHDGKIYTDYRNITNLRFADVVDALSEAEQELEALVKFLTNSDKGIDIINLNKVLDGDQC